MNTRRHSLFILAATLASAPAYAGPTITPNPVIQPSAPTKPVTASDLPVVSKPVPMDGLESIVNKNLDPKEPPRDIKKPEPVAAPVIAAPIIATPAEPMIDDDEGFLPRQLTRLRSFAIRWHDFFGILFLGGILYYIRRLTHLTQDQQKILARLTNLSEDTADAAKALLRKQENDQ
jgi:hypothetical protein